MSFISSPIDDMQKDLSKIIDHFLEDKGSDIAGREKMKNERQADIQTDKEKRERQMEIQITSEMRVMGQQL